MTRHQCYETFFFVADAAEKKASVVCLKQGLSGWYDICEIERSNV
jgi:hypothetical protein